MRAGFSTHPGVPTNSASFNCIPLSYFCQFKQTICEPFCHWVEGFWLPEATRRPFGYTLLKCLRECVIRCCRECGNKESIPDSEMFIITGTGYSDPSGSGYAPNFFARRMYLLSVYQPCPGFMLLVYGPREARASDIFDFIDRSFVERLFPTNLLRTSVCHS